MVIVKRMIPNLKKEYFHICCRNKQKYLIIAIVHLMYKELKMEQEELLDGKSSIFKIVIHLRQASVEVILENMLIYILIQIYYKK